MAANPRAAAVAALVRQEQDGFSNLVLDAELRRQKLEGRDKAFASAIFYTVLEHRGTLDYILEQFLPKGLAKLDAPVREILRAALAQACYMQVPVSAAVNEAVKLTRTFKKSSASGLVNAVLRKACGYDLDAAVFTDEIQRLMVLGSAGRDVAEFLHKNYPDEALGILTYQADGGLTSLRANPQRRQTAARCLQSTRGAAEVAGYCARQRAGPICRQSGRPRTVPAGILPWKGQASQLAPCRRQNPVRRCLICAPPPAARPRCWPRKCRTQESWVIAATRRSRTAYSSSAPRRNRMGFTNVNTLAMTPPNKPGPAAGRRPHSGGCLSGLGILAKAGPAP